MVTGGEADGNWWGPYMDMVFPYKFDKSPYMVVDNEKTYTNTEHERLGYPNKDKSGINFNRKNYFHIYTVKEFFHNFLRGTTYQKNIFYGRIPLKTVNILVV